MRFFKKRDILDNDNITWIQPPTKTTQGKAFVGKMNDGYMLALRNVSIAYNTQSPVVFQRWLVSELEKGFKRYRKVNRWYDEELKELRKHKTIGEFIKNSRDWKNYSQDSWIQWL